VTDEAPGIGRPVSDRSICVRFESLDLAASHRRRRRTRRGALTAVSIADDCQQLWRTASTTTWFERTASICRAWRGRRAIKGTDARSACRSMENGRYAYLDPRLGAVLAVGGRHAIVPHRGSSAPHQLSELRYPERPGIMWQFARRSRHRRSVRALNGAITGGRQPLTMRRMASHLSIPSRRGWVSRNTPTTSRQQSFQGIGRRRADPGEGRGGWRERISQARCTIRSWCSAVLDLARERALQALLWHWLRSG